MSKKIEGTFEPEGVFQAKCEHDFPAWAGSSTANCRKCGAGFLDVTACPHESQAVLSRTACIDGAVVEIHECRHCRCLYVVKP